MKILLSDHERGRCFHAATLRVRANDRRHREGKIIETKITKAPSLEIEFDGIQAEVAVAKGFSAKAPCLEHPLAKDLEDVVLANGETIEVKFTNHGDGHLLIPSWQKNKLTATWLILVLPTELEGGFKFEGRIRREVFLENAYAWHLPPLGTIAMGQKGLKLHGEPLCDSRRFSALPGDPPNIAGSAK